MSATCLSAGEQLAGVIITDLVRANGLWVNAMHMQIGGCQKLPDQLVP